MTDYTVTIADAAHLFGLTAAVARKNASLSKEETPFDEASYVQFLVEKACESYANDFPMPTKATYQAAIDAISAAKLTATDEDAAKLARLEADLTAVKDGNLADVAAVAAEAVAV
jgi:hypothetical protein